MLLLTLLECSCCNMRKSQNDLNKMLDSGDISGSVKAMDDPCITNIPHIKTTKAVLIYRLSMYEKDAKEKAKLKNEAIKLLEIEAASGYFSAVEILESYKKIGDSYFVTFPWGGLLGPSMPKGQTRTY